MSDYTFQMLKLIQSAYCDEATCHFSLSAIPAHWGKHVVWKKEKAFTGKKNTTYSIFALFIVTFIHVNPATS